MVSNHDLPSNEDEEKRRQEILAEMKSDLSFARSLPQKLEVLRDKLRMESEAPGDSTGNLEKYLQTLLSLLEQWDDICNGKKKLNSEEFKIINKHYSMEKFYSIVMEGGSGLMDATLPRSGEVLSRKDIHILEDLVKDQEFRLYLRNSVAPMLVESKSRFEREGDGTQLRMAVRTEEIHAKFLALQEGESLTPGELDLLMKQQEAYYSIDRAGYSISIIFWIDPGYESPVDWKNILDDLR
jgi:hypothetical protein